ncbi:MAG: phosphatidate cytidylyltransferase [Bacteroidales bacterium]|nr:phosphatidate cytidylyltransferase [Bacteroidales bacterium]
MSNLVQRALSGAIFILVVIGAILLHPYFFAGVFTLFTAWALLEFYHICGNGRMRLEKPAGTAIGAFLFLGSFLFRQGLADTKIFLWLIPVTVALFIRQLYQKHDSPFRGIVCTLAGLVYIAVPFALLTGLAFPNSADNAYTPDILVGFFVLLWTNDTFAYLAGICFGKHRLFERISPKKSWEGFFGGLLFTLAASLPVAHFLPVLAYYHWIAVAAIVVVFGVYGDLMESLLKRCLNIKDSGHFLPGHGGILDRFDAVLLAAPMVYFYLQIFVC